MIIDRVPEGLETVLLERFRFPVEVMYLAMYEGEDGQRAYKYEPFLADVLPAPSGSDAPRQQVTDPTDIDTVVVPARPGGFERTFLGEHRWHAIRVHASMRDHIKWIAAYQVAPTSAITHVPPVRSIEPWEDSGKVVIKFAEAAHQIDAIGLVSDGRIGGLQNLRYTAKSHLDEAQTLDDLW